MAGIPQPRSYQSLLGGMIDAFLSRYGLRGLKTGGPLLSALEAAAQADMHGAQDVFNLLNATDIDRASGLALDRKAADEEVTRRSVTFSSGSISVLDTSFAKIATKVYPGAAAPNAGTQTLKISDGSKFPATGSVYLGRDTVNYEGPISYTSVSQPGGASYWQLTLSTPTQKFHDLNESVVLAQAGDRVVPAGSVVRTAQGNSGTATSFTTLDAATLLDGEVQVDGVGVLCQQAGTIGNVIKGAIVEFATLPFAGASATNALPIDNGFAAEDDASLRERIKAKRQSRSLGTPLALVTNAKGVQAGDEHKTVISASVFSAQGEPTVLYIDDGTGYEETNDGVGSETLMDQALSGEQYFRLNGGSLPVSKAFSKSTFSAPFALTDAAQLAVKVAGVLSQHQFHATSFRAISNATAYEVVSSINGNPDILFSARTANNGTTIVLFARSELNEDVEVVAPETGVDANAVLGFQTGINYSLRLYKNDRLLYKDGRSAIVSTTPQTQWGSTIASGVYLKIRVDATKPVVYKITDQDFIDAGTGYTTVSALNSLESWAAVLNAKVTGITASVASGRLQLVSNRGASGAAAVVISEPSSSDLDSDGVLVVSAINNLVKKSVFTETTGLSAVGVSNDYTLNRNTGELKLTRPLATGDTLTAGSAYTRAYTQGGQIPTSTVTFAANARLWVAVDSGAAIVTTGLNAGTALDLTNPAGTRARYTSSTAAALFTNLKQGDWAIIWDPAFTRQGAWRVAVATSTYFELEQSQAFVSQTGVAPTSNGIVFVRTSAPLQALTLTSGADRSLSSIATEMNATLIGATASVYRNKFMRVTTNTSASNGDVMVVAADIEGQKLLFTRGSLVTNNPSHLAAVAAGNEEAGSPDFTIGTVSALPGTLGTQLTLSGSTPNAKNLVRFLRRDQGVAGIGYANLLGEWSAIADATASPTLTLRKTMTGALVNDRIVQVSPYSIGPEDDVTVILDNLPGSRNYNIPLYRNIKPLAGQTYGATFTVLDVDNANQTLSKAFGSTDANFFQDFVLYAHARVKSHAGTNGTPSGTYHHNKALLWRYTRMGPEGNGVDIQYVNPTAANQPLAITTATAPTSHVKVTLPSGAARGSLNLYDTTKFTVSVSGGSPADTVTYTYSKPSVTLQRVSNVVTGTTGSNHGFVPGDVVYVTSVDVNFPSGAKTVVTATTATTFTYNEAGADSGPSAAQTVSSAPSDPNFGSVAVGDIAINASGAFRVSAKTSTTYTVKVLSGTLSAVTTPVSLGSSTALQFVPINTVASTASAIATWINADAASIVTAVAVENGGGSPGAGAIDVSTVDEYLLGYGNDSSGAAVSAWALKDGVNYIASSNVGVSTSTITLKNAVTSALASNSDFDNEQFRLVPVMVAGLSKYLGSPAVSGLYANSSLASTSRGGRLQLMSSTIGADGAVQVTGGSANAVGASIVGAAATLTSTYIKATVSGAQARGIIGGQLVAIQGSNTQAKAVSVTSASILQSIAASASNWKLTFDNATNLRSQASQTLLTSPADMFIVDRVGRFVCYQLVSANPLNGAAVEGSWVRINIAAANAANNGTFQIVRASTQAFWVENQTGVTEYVSVAGGDTITYYTYDSVMPGDTLIIDTTAFGANNQGSFTVVEDLANTVHQVTVTGNMAAYASGATLGTLASSIRFIEAQPVRAIKRVTNLIQTPGASSYMDVVFDTNALVSKLSSSAGASIQPLDKLGFTTSVVGGVDAYSYSTGLIGEVNKVIYGDASNPSVYPGVVAAGAQVNICGPLVKRVAVGLAIRVRTGASSSDIISRVKSAVASTINGVSIGESVAISSIVSAAAAIDGVMAVTILNPIYASGSDLIAVQANEKPRVLDLDADITVSIVG
jgi:hypothetical protein